MLSRFKKTRTEQAEKLAKGFEDDNQKKSSGGGDDALWKPTFDEDRGTGSAVIRFLPYSEDELPWVKVFSHGFKGPTGKWYIENSLTTLGKDDPVGQLNSRLWNSGVESDKQVARDQKRRTSYFANVLVIKDPANRENEGKVFVYRFGKKIFDKIQAELNPEFDDLDPVNVFDLWEGKNLNIRMKKVAGYLNYDSSSFESQSPVDADDAVIEKHLENTYNLKERYLGEDAFSSFEDLRKHLFEVLGPYSGSGVPTVEGWEDAKPSAAQSTQTTQKAAEAAKAPAKEATPDVPAASSVDDEDLDSMFDDILNGDD
jgi:hypothetical protein